MQDILELQEFFVEGGDQNKSHILLHITEPDTSEEKDKGYFFAVAEINNAQIEQIEHLQQMIDDMESGYYETSDEKDKNSFEINLEFINRRGHHLLQYKDSIMNCLVGVLRGHEIYFAYHGKPLAKLFYKSKEEYEEMDVVENADDENKDQLFSSMMQGSISSGDYFYISSPHVNDYFTSDRIKKILISRTTRQSVEHIQKVLNDLKNGYSFGGIILHFPTKDEVPKTGKMPKVLGVGSEKSLDNMVNREKETADTLSPPLLGNLKKKISEIKEQTPKNKLYKEELSKPVIESNFRPRDIETKDSLLNIILVSLGRAIVVGITSLFKFIKNTILIIGRGSVLLILLITNKDNKRRDVIKNLKNHFYNQLEKISNLPTLSKIILLITIILGVVFIGSIIFYKTKASIQAKNVSYNNLVQLINDKKMAADASIMYHDDAKALTLLQEAKDSLLTLPQGSKTEKTKYEELNKDIESSLQKLRKIEIINPELILDIRQTNPKAETNKIVRIDNTIISYGINDPAFYIVNPDSKQLEVKEHNLIPKLIEANTPKENDFILFVTGDKTIAYYNKDTKSFSIKDISFPIDNTKIQNIFIYNRKLYLLDTTNNQILKHSATQTGYDKGQSWIKDQNIDIKDAVSLAIDGDVFVLKTNGEILKFAGGVKQDFNISGLDPRLENPNQIWTYNGINNLYILEAKNKRIIVLDKTGKLIKQYTTNWENPTSMIVDESKKTIFVLDNNKIYKFGI